MDLMQRRRELMMKARTLYFEPTTSVATNIIVGANYENIRFAGAVICKETLPDNVAVYRMIFSDQTGGENAFNCWRILPYRKKYLYANCGSKPSMTEFYQVNDTELGANVSFVQGERIEFDFYKNHLSINDTLIPQKRNSVYAAINDAPIMIGNYYKFEYFKAFVGWQLIADYVPRQINGDICFYDNVSNTYITP